jgi:SEL1 protein
MISSALAHQLTHRQATLYYTFSALQGFRPAEMALGYRYWAGIGVKEVSTPVPLSACLILQDCQTALDWYESAAEKCMFHFSPTATLTQSLYALP